MNLIRIFALWILSLTKRERPKSCAKICAKENYYCGCNIKGIINFLKGC